MIALFGVLAFVFCTWAVFSKYFCDGIIVKHLLSFSAITSMLAVLDPSNTDAALTALGLLVTGIAYWFFKHRALIEKRLSELFR